MAQPGFSGPDPGCATLRRPSCGSGERAVARFSGGRRFIRRRTSSNAGARASRGHVVRLAFQGTAPRAGEDVRKRSRPSMDPPGARCAVHDEGGSRHGGRSMSPSRSVPGSREAGRGDLIDNRRRVALRQLQLARGREHENEGWRAGGPTGGIGAVVALRRTLETLEAAPQVENAFVAGCSWARIAYIHHKVYDGADENTERGWQRWSSRQRTPKAGPPSSSRSTAGLARRAGAPRSILRADFASAREDERGRTDRRAFGEDRPRRRVLDGAGRPAGFRPGLPPSARGGPGRRLQPLAHHDRGRVRADVEPAPGEGAVERPAGGGRGGPPQAKRRGRLAGLFGGEGPLSGERIGSLPEARVGRIVAGLRFQKASFFGR